MRIGLVIYGDLEVISGGYLYNKQLVNYWRANGHVVTIFSLPWRNYWGHFGDNFRLRWLNQLLTADIDVLVQDELNHPSLVGINVILRKRASYPIVSLLHLLRYTEPHSPLTTSFYKMVERRYLGEMDGIICNSLDTAKAVKRLNQKQIPQIVAYPGGDHWTLNISDDEIRGRGAEAGPLRVLYVGNVIRRKGLAVLIEALMQIDKSSWRLTAIGRQDLEPAYAKKIAQLITNNHLEDQIQLLGAVPFAEMPAYFKNHQLFVMPSFYEPFGIVYIEAMGAGLPVIASTAGAGRELIEQGKNGYLVRVGDSSEIAKCVEKLAHNRPILAQMGVAARRKHNLHPTWAETGEQITSFIENLIS